MQNKTPTKYEVGQAAELLGTDLFYLARALVTEAETQFLHATQCVREFESPNFGPARALLRAAQVADEAWREEVAIAEEVDA